MNEILLGIDAGTSAVKVCAFTPAGELHAKAQRPVPLITSHLHWAELDLERYWELVTDALREVSADAGPVVGIGIATTCPTTVLLDAQLEPVRPSITYLDNRASGMMHRLVRRLGGEEAAFAATGNRMSPSTCSAGTLRWVMEYEPEAWARVRHVGFLNTFLVARLTGELATDPTQASYSGLFSVREPARGWCPELLEAVGVPRGHMVPIHPPEQRVGSLSATAARSTGLAPGTPVAIGAADTASAAFALGINRGYKAFESVGTSGVVTFCLDEPTLDPAFLNRQHIIPNLWLAHGAMSTVGGAFGWLNDKVWPELHDLAELEQLAASSEPGANGVVFLPYLAGERSPLWDPNASGAWIGLRLGNDRADLVRAVFEGTAYGILQIVRRAEECWGWRPQRMLSVGGGTKSRFWLQIKADALGMELSRGHITDASALGAALLGGITGGMFESVTDPQLPTVRSEGDAVSPSADEQHLERYQRMARIYDGLYPALATSMSELAAVYEESGAFAR
ncbi:xylulokinase [Spiribacter halobius]|uniref:XylB n=1 Tax=Sediminicurvatus halobius TaxID=2182432 RepID=A0A2U2MXC7_9GAMM|nr:FGGY family carbohydrate kinase [Spiribacter halobius]PWG61521.1 XylB [Spiribacter halobius]UEX78000.1 hypothetical protein LMH63_19075 [Spiribacter halobius]